MYYKIRYSVLRRGEAGGADKSAMGTMNRPLRSLADIYFIQSQVNDTLFSRRLFAILNCAKEANDVLPHSISSISVQIGEHSTL